MGAWKLRALVYGLLAVVAALVVAARLEHDDAVAVPPAKRLTGRTSQGGTARFELRRHHLDTFRITNLRLTCSDGRIRQWSWGAYPSEPGATFVESGSGGFAFRNRYREFDLTMQGRVSASGHRVDGDVELTEQYPGGSCQSGRVSFSASR